MGRAGRGDRWGGHAGSGGGECAEFYRAVPEADVGEGRRRRRGRGRSELIQDIRYGLFRLARYPGSTFNCCDEVG
jgi:hypothetical protein